MTTGFRVTAPPRRPAALRPGEVALQIRDVTVEFDGRAVLDRVSLDVRAGEVLALVGPNGAGKSTLFNVITSDVETKAGEVLVEGRPGYAWTNTELAMRRAVLLQQVDIAFPFSVEEVVDMGREPWRAWSTPAQDDLVVRGALKRTETEQFVGRRYPSLSGGERSRAALARVLAQTASVLMLDEPTATLDIRHQELVFQLVREYAATGNAVVIIVHDLNLAAAYADRVALLSGGEIVAEGKSVEVLTPENVSRVYDYPVQVLEDPNTKAPIIVPVRGQDAPMAKVSMGWTGELGAWPDGPVSDMEWRSEA